MNYETREQLRTYTEEFDAAISPLDLEAILQSELKLTAASPEILQSQRRGWLMPVLVGVLVVFLVGAVPWFLRMMDGPIEVGSVVTTMAPCPYGEDGGVCLGPLGEGTYSSTSFAPDLRYTVPGGWENAQDRSGNFVLQKTGDVRYLAVYQNVKAPAECEDVPAPGVGTSVEELTEWYTTHPGLVVTEPVEVTVGGLTGVFLDISLDPSWDVTCEFSEGRPVVPFLLKDDPMSYAHHVILPGFEERLYILEWFGGNVAIEVGPEGGPLDDYLSEVLPIIDSMSFGE